MEMYYYQFAIKIFIHQYGHTIMSAFTAPVIASLIAFAGTIVVAIISIYNNKRTSRDNKRLVERTDLIEKSKIIDQKLNEFYLPLRHYLEHSKTLFKIFLKGKPEGFRTLTYLLDPQQRFGDEKKRIKLNSNDKALLRKIFEIGSSIEKLIHEKSYLIGSDEEFTKKYVPSEAYSHIKHDKELTLISLLLSHIIAIRMAFQGEISGETDKFEGYVFPNEITSKVESKIRELETQLRNFESKISFLMKNSK